MKGEGASEAGDREKGMAGAEEKGRNERKDAGNGSRILTNWKAVKPKAQRRAPSPALVSQKSIDVRIEEKGRDEIGTETAFLEPK